MLEILGVIALCKKMGAMMRDKGYEKPFWFQFFVVFCWLGGEVIGGISYAVIRVMSGKQSADFDIMGYVFALAGALFGAGIVFLIANLLPPKTPTS